MWNVYGTDGMEFSIGKTDNDQAGYSVALNSPGNIVAVGENGYSVGAAGRGRVITYKLNTSGSTWDIYGANGTGFSIGESSNARSGYRVSMNGSGDVVAVGEVGYPGNNKGRVVTYKLNATNNTWDVYGTNGTGILIGEVINSYAGSGVALNDTGNVVAVGELGFSSNKGRVVMYKLNTVSNTWNVYGTNGTGFSVGEFDGDKAGSNLSMNGEGDIVSVGEPEYSIGGNNKGRVVMYKFNTSSGAWDVYGTNGTAFSVGKNINGNSGWSMAVNGSGNVVAVGEPTFGGDDGRVITYKLNTSGNTWDVYGTNGTGFSVGDANPGWSVAINNAGDVVAVGENSYLGFKGRVSTYKLDSENNIWDVYGTNGTGFSIGYSSGQAGYSAALNDAGNVVAVGEFAYGEVGVGKGRVVIYSIPLPDPPPDPPAAGPGGSTTKRMLIITISVVTISILIVLLIYMLGIFA